MINQGIVDCYKSFGSISANNEVLPSADCPQPHSVAKLGRGQKRADYLLFKQAVNLLLNCKARSSIGGIKNIISIRGVNE